MALSTVSLALECTSTSAAASTSLIRSVKPMTRAAARRRNGRPPGAQASSTAQAEYGGVLQPSAARAGSDGRRRPAAAGDGDHLPLAGRASALRASSRERAARTRGMWAAWPDACCPDRRSSRPPRLDSGLGDEVQVDPGVGRELKAGEVGDRREAGNVEPPFSAQLPSTRSPRVGGDDHVGVVGTDGQNLSSQFYIELNLNAVDYSLIIPQIVSVIRLSDGYELWNSTNEGSIIIGNSGNYQLIFTGFHSPAINDKVLVIYYTEDNNRFQPFAYTNEIIKTRIDTLDIDGITNQFEVPLNHFTSVISGLSFNVVEPNTNIILFTITDGYLATFGSTAIISSPTVNFDTLPNLTAQKIIIFNSTEINNGTYDIVSYDINSNDITITNVLDHITKDQVAVIRLLDNQELWNYNGTIDIANNRLLFPIVPSANIGDKVFIILFRFKNLRKSPTKLISTITDQVVNNGTINVSGLTLGFAQDIVFTATSTGLKLNLSEAVRTALNLSSTATIPNTIKLVNLLKAEKVITAGATDNSVLEVSATYDIFNTTLQNNLLYADQMLANPSLLNLDFILPSTINNTLDVQTHNVPKLGDKIRVSFYYTTDNDFENINYTRNGTLYTNKKFAIINKTFVSSGFKSSQSSKITITSFTQPTLGSRYSAFYNYLAPKQNERIVVNYNFNNLIGNTTFAIESTRPINADVLAREAQQVLLDLTINVVISSDFINSTSTVLQNLRDAMTTALTSTTLGAVVDQPTIINAAQAVQGIARARILYFNKDGGVGQVLTMQALNNQYFAANNIVINTETR